MKVYLASRYSRREEMLEYARDLERRGAEVTSRWVNGGHTFAGKDEGAYGAPAEMKAIWASEDVEDVLAANILISFTETPREMNSSRGGRHVEFGLALGAGKRLFLVGPRENVFHDLPQVEAFDHWGDALRALGLL